MAAIWRARPRGRLAPTELCAWTRASGTEDLRSLALGVAHLLSFSAVTLVSTKPPSNIKPSHLMTP